MELPASAAAAAPLGKDHAEGLAVLAHDGAQHLLIVFNSLSDKRLKTPEVVTAGPLTRS